MNLEIVKCAICGMDYEKNNAHYIFPNEDTVCSAECMGVYCRRPKAPGANQGRL